jgi:acetylornithine/N-succinyldiaminopimelate aminotransferase
MSYLMNTISTNGLEVTGGAGSDLYIENDGKEEVMLDFFTDSGTASLGYYCEELEEANNISGAFPLHIPNMFDSELREQTAKKVCKATGFDKIFFCNSGSESIETAIKLARKYQSDKGINGGRTQDQIWSVRNSFHGRTYGALSVGDGPRYHYDGFYPMLNSCYHFSDIEEINFRLAAAVVLCPVFCNNDVKFYDPSWLYELKRRCEETDTLLVYDEVQTGCGRTGEITFAKCAGVKPHIVTLAKGFGMGFPVAACLAEERVAKSFYPGTHFSTFGGSPPALVHVSKMFDWLSGKNLAKIRYKGEVLKHALEKEKWVKDCRGIGLFIAFDIKGDAREFSKRCLKKGLIIGAFRKNPVKITPPLNIDMEDIQAGVSTMRCVAEEMNLC